MLNVEYILEQRRRCFSLKCGACSRIACSPSVRNVHCRCGGIYQIQYRSEQEAVWEMPLADASNLIRLGQDFTSGINLQRIADHLGIEAIIAKLECGSPTGSFKDRGSATLVSAAVEEGISEFVEDSSGNAGASMAAYAAAAGIKAHIFAPSTAAKGKLDQIRIFGAELHLIDGPRQAATDAAADFARKNGILYLSHALSPWFAEGVKKIAHEVQTENATKVTDFVVPAGNGSLLIGIDAGYEPYLKPRLHCVQSEAVRPIASLVNSEHWSTSDAASTVASGIAVSAPPRAEQAAQAVIRSGGAAVTVSDESILEWQRRIAEMEGIFCEATATAAFAGLEKLVASEIVSAESIVVVPITGSGLKEPLV